MENTEQSFNENILQGVSFKIDRLYNNALKYLKQHLVLFFIMQFVKAAYLGGIIGYSFKSQDFVNSPFFIPLVSAAFLSILLGFIYLAQLTKVRDLFVNMIFAKSLGHLVEGPSDPSLQLDVFEDWISNVYDARDPNQTVENKQQQKRTAGIIKNFYLFTNKCVKLLYRFCDIGLFGIVVWLIVQLALNETSQTSKILIIIFISFEMLINYKVLVICFFIALLPLIIILLLICVVSSFKTNNNNSVINALNPIDYKDSSHGDRAEDCAVCFTNFHPEEKVCVLECPAKHIFHEICIKSWFKIRVTCPTCRHDFSQIPNVG